MTRVSRSGSAHFSEQVPTQTATKAGTKKVESQATDSLKAKTSMVASSAPRTLLSLPPHAIQKIAASLPPQDVVALATARLQIGADLKPEVTQAKLLIAAAKADSFQQIKTLLSPKSRSIPTGQRDTIQGLTDARRTEVLTVIAHQMRCLPTPNDISGIRALIKNTKTMNQLIKTLPAAMQALSNAEMATTRNVAKDLEYEQTTGFFNSATPRP
jgi:hypothetical protein